MPCAIPEFKREVIKVKIELKQHDKTIAKDTSVSERTIRAYKKNLRDHGTLCPPKAVLQGRPRKITLEMQEVRVNSYQHLLPKADD
jgi:transposase